MSANQVSTSSNLALDAIRERDAEYRLTVHVPGYDIACADRRVLLEEVDRLTLATMSESDYLNGQRHERARIAAAVKAVEWVGCGGWGCATRAGEIYDAVLVAIEGDV